MSVDPANAAAVEPAVPDELHHFDVGERFRLAHRLVRLKKLCASSAVADQQLAVNEIVTKHLIIGEKPVEFTRVRFSPRQKAYPNGCIDKDH